ncbi:hypothetical protein J2X77_004389 [Sphingobacterium sp. 2149]|nr:hypothetical protein [Sphingobacterium sp. 2149]
MSRLTNLIGSTPKLALLLPDIICPMNGQYYTPTGYNLQYAVFYFTFITLNLP